MKAILVIDMPDMCLNCDLYAFQGCYPLQRRIDRDGLKMVDKPDWCPLKPMPKKFEAPEIYELWNTDSEYFNGWNDCIDTITGETE